MIEVRPMLSAKKCSPKNLLFGNVRFVVIFSDVTESKRCVELESENSTCATMLGDLRYNTWALVVGSLITT